MKIRAMLGLRLDVSNSVVDGADAARTNSPSDPDDPAKDVGA